MLGALRVWRFISNPRPGPRIHPMSKADRLFWELLHERRKGGTTTKD
jgi:hypothetical protein